MSYNIAPFLAEHLCFTREELAAFMSKVLRKRQVAAPVESVLKRLHKPGGPFDHALPVRGRSGLYLTRAACQTPGANGWLPYLLVMKAGARTVISHQAALWLHLKEESAPAVLRYYDSASPESKPWGWDGHTFERASSKQPPDALTGGGSLDWCLVPITLGGRTFDVRVTTPERTLVDILGSRARRRPGSDESDPGEDSEEDGPENHSDSHSARDGLIELDPEFLACWAKLREYSLRLDFRVLRAHLLRLGSRATTSKVAYYLSGNHERHGIPADFLWALSPRLKYPRPWREGMSGDLVLPWLLRVPAALKHPPRAVSSDRNLNRLAGGQSIETLDLLACLRALYRKPEVVFRPGQGKLIRDILEGHDAFGIIPTGAGKSLCYQLPATLLNGLTLVVSPLLALMNEQVEKAKEMGISAMAFGGIAEGPSPKFGISETRGTTRDQVLMGIQQANLKLLFVSPESLTTLVGAFEELKAAVVQLVVDEAHTILTWGQDFRQALRGLHRLRALWPDVPILALTATANRSEHHRIMAELGFRADTVPYVGSTYRPGLYLQTKQVANGLDKKVEALVAFIHGQEKHRGKRLCGIVYCRSKKETEKVAIALAEQFGASEEAQDEREALEEGFLAKFEWAGWQAQPDPSDGTFCLPFHSRVQCYHAGLSRRNRDQAEFVFRRGKARIMVATVAFGMGIDKDDVRFVAHCGPPTAIGDYVQEVGRAGRDGSEAECLLLHSPQDWKIWRKRFQANEGAASKVSKRHQRPLSSGQEKARARNLKRHLDELERFEALVDGACLHQAIAKHYDEDIDPCEQHCCKCQNPSDHRKAWHVKHAAQVEPPREAMRLSQEEDWEPVPASELLDEAASDPTYGVALLEPDPEWPIPGLSPDPMDEMAPLDPTEAVEEFLKSAHGHPQVE